MTVYPYRAFEADWASWGEEYEVRLDGYETRVIEFWPAEKIDFPLPFEVRFETGADGVRVFPAGTSGKIQVENCSVKEVNVAGVAVPVGVRADIPLENQNVEQLAVSDRRSEDLGGRGSALAGELELGLPAGTASAEIAFVVESDEALPELKPEISADSRKLEFHTLAGEGNRWYWFSAPLGVSPAHTIRYNFAAGSAAAGRGTLTAWLVLHRQLEGRQIELPGFAAAVEGRFLLPAESGLKREVACLFKRPVEF